jgi:hypothetical protein
MQCDLIDRVDDLTALVKLRDNDTGQLSPTRNKIGAMSTVKNLLLKASSTIEAKAILWSFLLSKKLGRHGADHSDCIRYVG